MGGWLLLLLLWLAPAMAEAPWRAWVPAPDTPHHDLEVLYAEGAYDEGLALARQRVAASPDDPLLRFHATRFLYEVGERFERTDRRVDKVALYEEMAEHARHGLRHAPDDPKLHFGLGVALGRLGTTRGVLASLRLASELEASFLAATQEADFRYSSLGGEMILPCDAYLTLSVFYRLVPDSFVVQALAGTRGDLARSVDYARLGDACVPGTIRHLKELGVAKLCYGRRRGDREVFEAGLASLRRAAAAVPRHATERIDVRHARLLLDEPRKACGYSRDGQQEEDGG